MLAAASTEWAVKSHGRNTKSLRRVRGFRVVPVEWAIKTIFGYDLNLSAQPISSLCEGVSGIIAERDAKESAQCAVLAEVNR